MYACTTLSLHYAIGRVYFEFQGQRLSNFGQVPLSLVGELDNAVHCKTYKQDCCGLPVENRIGEFYFPNGTRVPIQNAGYGFYRNRDDQVVRLNRKRNVTAPKGIFTCEIPDEVDKLRTISIA